MANLATQFIESLAASWRGYERLWIVFWLYYVTGAIALYFIPESTHSAWYIWVPTTLISVVWLVWVMVSLWRCAYLTDYRILGHLVRLNVFIGVAVFLFDLSIIHISVIAS